MLLLPLLIGAAEPEQRPERPLPADNLRSNNIVGLNVARWHQPRYIRAAADVVNANGGAWGYVTVLLTNADRDGEAGRRESCQHVHWTFPRRRLFDCSVGCFRVRFNAAIGESRPGGDAPRG